jgi:hypothetical protein
MPERNHAGILDFLQHPRQLAGLRLGLGLGLGLALCLRLALRLGHGGGRQQYSRQSYCEK